MKIRIINVAEKSVSDWKIWNWQIDKNAINEILQYVLSGMKLHDA